MRINPGFEIVTIADDYMLVPVGNQIDSFNGTVILNDTSAFLLKNIREAIKPEELVNLLMNEYEVDADTAREDVDNALERFRSLGVIYD